MGFGLSRRGIRPRIPVTSRQLVPGAPSLATKRRSLLGGWRCASPLQKAKVWWTS